MSIQSSVNQTLGVAAIATKLSPQLQELGDEVRTSTESNRVESQLKKLASKSYYTDYDPKTGAQVAVLDDEDAFKYLSLVEKKKMLNKKKMDLGLTPTGWDEFPSEALAPDEAADLEEMGKLQRVKVERIKEVKKKIRDSQFGGENYGNDKQ